MRAWCGAVSSSTRTIRPLMIAAVAVVIRAGRPPQDGRRHPSERVAPDHQQVGARRGADPPLRRGGRGQAPRCPVRAEGALGLDDGGLRDGRELRPVRRWRDGHELEAAVWTGELGGLADGLTTVGGSVDAADDESRPLKGGRGRGAPDRMGQAGHVAREVRRRGARVASVASRAGLRSNMEPRRRG